MSSRVLGLDHGAKRVGLALSDPGRVIATSLEVVPREVAIDRIRAVIAEFGVAELVVGLPTTLRGHEGQAATAAREFGAELARLTGLPVSYVDERFTTHIAEAAMLEAGVRRRDRRQAVDKVAATVILQAFLDRSR